MKRSLVRRPSRAAYLAQSTALLALVLMVIAALALRYEFIDGMSWFITMGAVVLIAIVACIFAGFGLLALWRDGKRGGIASLRALFVALLIFAPLGYAGVKSASLPVLNDISTDLENVPQFPLGSRVDLGPELAPPLPKDQADIAQSAAYPDIVSRTYELPIERIRRALVFTAAELNWQPLSRAGNIDEADGERYAYLSQTFILRFKDDIVIRLLGEDDMVQVDMRSAGRFGASDLGNHAVQIRTFYRTLERVLKSLPQDEQAEPV